MKTRNRRSKAPVATQAAECLETRKMLTADITAEVVNGQLNIVEEGLQDADADVQVRFFDYAGGVQVIGSNGTTINGAPSAFFMINYRASPQQQADAFNSISIDLGSGDDLLQIDSYDGTKMILSRLNIDVGSDSASGSDDDVVVVSDVDTPNLTVLTAGVHSDVDTVEIRDSFAHELLTVMTGDMDDVVTISEVEAGQVFVDTDGGLSPRDSGNDDVFITGLTARGSVTINGGSGDPTADDDQDSVNIRNLEALDNLFIDLGNDDLDNITGVNLKVENDLTIEGGEGVDVIDLEGLSVGRNAFINTYGGNDWIRISEARIGNWLIAETGDLEDTVILDSLWAYGINVFTGDHDDVVDVNDVGATYGAIRGNDGNNTLIRRGRVVWLRQGGFKGF